jgi:uncharacterized membrane protein (DUF2068 family)
VSHLTRSNSSAGLLLIAWFKLLKAALLVAVGVGAFKLLNKDVSDVAEHWIDVFRVDPDNRYIHGLLVRLSSVDARKLKEIGVGTFFYAGLLFTEGAGLMLRKRWAAYFTIFMTASFLPLEMYELFKKFTAAKMVVIGINVGIVWYLIVDLLGHSRRTG